MNSFIKNHDGVELILKNGRLKVKTYFNNIIRIMYTTKQAFPNVESLMVNWSQYEGCTCKVEEDEKDIFISTTVLNVIVDKETGDIRFLDTIDNIILCEIPGSRRMISAGTPDDSTYKVVTSFEYPGYEGLYGLGQHPGTMNYQGSNAQLVQIKNRTVSPFLLSTAGYGVLWDNNSATYFESSALPQPVELLEHRPLEKTKGYEAAFETKEKGRYSFHIDKPNGVKLWINNHPIINNVDAWVDAVNGEYLAEDAVSIQDQGKISHLRIEPGIGRRCSFKINLRRTVKDARLLIGFSSLSSRTFVVRVDGTKRINFDDPEINLSNTWGQAQDIQNIRWVSIPLNLTLESGMHYVELEQLGSEGYPFWLHAVAIAGSDVNVRRTIGEIELPADSRINLRLEYDETICKMPPNLSFLGPESRMVNTFKSDVADMVDYYFIYGPEPDEIISGYRKITGSAPMFPKYALGFIQSKERYTCRDELMEIADGFRKREFPMDVLVQDWRYWDPYKWGSHRFDQERYPDPEGMIKELHEEYDTRFMISIWPCFEAGSDTFEEMKQAGMLFMNHERKAGLEPRSTVYTYNPFFCRGRELHWEGLRKYLFSLGVDAFWMDNTEPMGGWDFEKWEMEGFSGACYRNAYPLMHAKSIYEGWRETTNDKRVFLLSRSAFAGHQRYGAATWSGDIVCSWEELRRQIPAGLNFCMSGFPYWTSDIGGFEGGEKNVTDEYKELFVRWFQYGAFCPLFRVHGHQPAAKEPWHFGKSGDAAYDAIFDATRLRYRLMPYIYSLSWKVTNEGYTIMRGLIMDFGRDKDVYNINDQFMFGQSILVNPVITEGAESRHVYLPKGVKWHDFWTGKTYEGGRQFEMPAPLNRIPLFVDAGSIIPFGPVIQFTGEKEADPLELRIYPGADGRFILYEDEGDNYNYEKGVYSTIPFHWNESDQTLVIGKREGSFPGMLEKRTLHIIRVRNGYGTGINEEMNPDEVVTYLGEELSIKIKE